VHGATDHHTGQIGDGVQQRLEAGDFVRLVADVPLGQDKARGVVQGSEQMDLASPGGHAKALPVDGQAARPTFDGVAAVGNPDADGTVWCVAVDPAQQSPNRRFRGQGPLAGQRVEPRADMFQHVGPSIGDPLADRQERRRASQHRTGRQGQHHEQ
jgi:hypothetical protein